jgi:hypothetical protein
MKLLVTATRMILVLEEDGEKIVNTVPNLNISMTCDHTLQP